MYELKYDFKQYNLAIEAYLGELLKNSSKNFQNQLRSGQIKNSEKDSYALAGCIENVEEYLYYNFENNPSSFNSILNSTINNVWTISCLPSKNREIYGATEAQNKIIYINPELEASRTLTGEERTRLYMAHELGHIVNNEWMKKVWEYTRTQMRLGRLNEEHANLIYDGFSMLDEATTQERAEEFVYSFSGKARPRQVLYRSNRLFSSQPYKTNFDFYGELQAPATMFARTLRGIGKENDDSKALSLLASRATSPNFFSSILNEYTRDGQMPSFIREAQYMGLLKRASYANFGHENISYLQNSGRYLNALKEVTSNVRDYREPLTEDYNR